MEDWDLGLVRELASQYVEAGLGDTSSGRFLTSVATAGVPPRGGGVKWLQDLITQGDPRPRVASASEIEALYDRAGSLLPRLERMVWKLRAGQPLADWEQEILAEMRGRKVDDLIEPTPLQAMLLEAAHHRAQFQSPYYWAQRPGTLRRLQALYNRVQEGSKLPLADYEWLEKSFKTLHKELQTDISIVGDLRFHYDYRISQWLPIVVTGPPFYDHDSRAPAVQCLIQGEIRNIPIRSLSKRRPKK